MFFYVMLQKLAILLPAIREKVENVSNELCDLAKDEPCQCAEGVPTFFLVFKVKCEHREKIQKKVF